MLKAALCGSYVNFGVFRLYGDEALDNALNTFVKLLLSIPQSDLLVNIHISHNTNILFISQIICFLIIKFISAALMNYCAIENETIEIFIVLLFLYTVFPTALSKTVGNILFVARMSGARSHGLFIHFGTQGFPLHSLQYQRRPYSTRCAKRLLHRSVRLILSCYYSLYPQCHILKLKSILIFRQAYTN